MISYNLKEFYRLIDFSYLVKNFILTTFKYNKKKIIRFVYNELDTDTICIIYHKMTSHLYDTLLS